MATADKESASGPGGPAHKWLSKPGILCPDPLDEAGVPRDPARRIQALAGQYAEIWECKRPPPSEDESVSTACSQDSLPNITADMVKRAAKHFSCERAVSLDNLRPRHIELLPPEALSALAAVFNAFEKLGCIDEFVKSLVAFIPKRSAGERGIGIIVSIHALYEQVRLYIIQKWTADNERAYSWAGRNKGAEQC